MLYVNNILAPHFYLQVAWIQDDKQQILTLMNTVVTDNPMVKVALDPLNGDYVLTLEGVNLDDSGHYSCRIGSQPNVLHTFHLKVLGESVSVSQSVNLSHSLVDNT